MGPGGNGMVVVRRDAGAKVAWTNTERVAFTHSRLRPRIQGQEVRLSSRLQLPQTGHRGLIAWQKAMDLAEGVLILCDGVPNHESVGLLPQLRRAAVSVPSNIAEGYGRPKSEYGSYLRIARGSLREVETQVELLFRRGAVKTETAMTLLALSDELGRVLHGLGKRVDARA